MTRLSLAARSLAAYRDGYPRAVPWQRLDLNMIQLESSQMTARPRPGAGRGGRRRIRNLLLWSEATGLTGSEQLELWLVMTYILLVTMSFKFTTLLSAGAQIADTVVKDIVCMSSKL